MKKRKWIRFTALLSAGICLLLCLTACGNGARQGTVVALCQEQGTGLSVGMPVRYWGEAGETVELHAPYIEGYVPVQETMEVLFSEEPKQIVFEYERDPVFLQERAEAAPVLLATAITTAALCLLTWISNRLKRSKQQ